MQRVHSTRTPMLPQRNICSIRFSLWYSRNFIHAWSTRHPATHLASVSYLYAWNVRALFKRTCVRALYVCVRARMWAYQAIRHFNFSCIANRTMLISKVFHSPEANRKRLDYISRMSFAQHTEICSVKCRSIISLLLQQPYTGSKSAWLDMTMVIDAKLYFQRVNVSVSFSIVVCRNQTAAVPFVGTLYVSSSTFLFISVFAIIPKGIDKTIFTIL